MLSVVSLLLLVVLLVVVMLVAGVVDGAVGVVAIDAVGRRR